MCIHVQRWSNRMTISIGPNLDFKLTIFSHQFMAFDLAFFNEIQLMVHQKSFRSHQLRGGFHISLYNRWVLAPSQVVESLDCRFLAPKMVFQRTKCRN